MMPRVRKVGTVIAIAVLFLSVWTGVLSCQEVPSGSSTILKHDASATGAESQIDERQYSAEKVSFQSQSAPVTASKAKSMPASPQFLAVRDAAMKGMNSSGQKPLFGTDILITGSNAFDDKRPDAAVYPGSGGNTIIGTYEFYDGTNTQIGAMSSTDGGKTWISWPLFGGSTGQNEHKPVLAFTDNGTMFIIWCGVNPNDPGQGEYSALNVYWLYPSQTMFTGVAWSALQAVYFNDPDASCGNGTGFVFYVCSIRYQGKWNACFGYAEFPYETGGSSNDHQLFYINAQIEQGNCTCALNQTHALMAFEDKGFGGDKDAIFGTHDAWNLAATPTNWNFFSSMSTADDLTPCIALGGSTILVAYTNMLGGFNGNIIVEVSDNGGASYNWHIAANSTVRSEVFPRIVGDGTIANLAYLNETGGMGDIYWANSTDGGKTWSSWTKVDDCFTGQAYLMPRTCELLQNGTEPIVIWTDARNMNLDLYADYTGGVPPPALTVTVAGPSPGSVWWVGYASRVNWSISGGTAPYTIWVNMSKTGGAPYNIPWGQTTQSGAGIGYLDYTPVAADKSSTCQVQVEVVGGGKASGTSTGTFIICDPPGGIPPSVTVAGPASGSVWWVGFTYRVNWTISGGTAPYTIWVNLSKTGSAPYNIPWGQTTQPSAGSGYLDYIPVASDKSNTCQVQVEVVGGGKCSGTSPGTLIITDAPSGTPPTVTVTGPVYGDVWWVGYQYMVNWTIGGGMEPYTVWVNLSRTGSWPYDIPLGCTTQTSAGNGFWSTVPQTTHCSMTCRIQVEVVGGGKDWATSGLFVIRDLTTDTVCPTSTMLAPQDGQSVSDTVIVQAVATDNVCLYRIEFYVDGINRQSNDVTGTTAYANYSWNTWTELNAWHTLSVIVTDWVGNKGYHQISVLVSNGPDNIPPQVWIQEPHQGDILTGTVLVKVKATDNVGIYKVEFRTDWVLRQTNLTLYIQTTFFANYSWDTSGLTDGTHNLNVTVNDTSNNQASAQIWVTTTNPAPLRRIELNAPATVEEGTEFSVGVTSDNAPVENAEVLFMNMTKRTDGSGFVKFRAPQVNEDTVLKIKVFKAGYESKEAPITVKDKTVTGSGGSSERMTLYIILLIVFTFIVTALLFALSLKTKRPTYTEISVSNTCALCRGEIEENRISIKCSCGKVYHGRCAKRAEVCTSCMSPLIQSF